MVQGCVYKENKERNICFGNIHNVIKSNLPLFRRNIAKNSKMCKRDGMTFKVTPPFFEDFSSYFNHKYIKSVYSLLFGFNGCL